MDIDAGCKPISPEMGFSEVLPTTLPPPTALSGDRAATEVEDDNSDKRLAPSVDQDQRNSSSEASATEEQQQLFDVPSDILNRVLQADPAIYGITAEQYASIYRLYISTPLPNGILFPWLHGVDGTSFQQNLFFGVRRCLPPRYRGLMLVHADETCPYSARLIHAVLPSEIITAENEFINLAEKEQSVNLRNFRIQVSRFATISDIVVYGHGAEQVARRIAIAQAKLKQKRTQMLEDLKKNVGPRAAANGNDLTYRVFVVLGIYHRHHAHLDDS